MNRVIVFIILLTLSSQAAFFDSGRNEVGGTIAISSYGNPMYSMDVYQLSLDYNFYLNRFVGFGPIISFYKTSFASYLTPYELDLGIEATIGMQFGNSFVFLSPGVSYVEYPYLNGLITYVRQETAQSSLGIPIHLGLKTMISGHFGFEGSIKYEAVLDAHEYFHDLGLEIGLIGLF
jgi:hypothetical protein